MNNPTMIEHDDVTVIEDGVFYEENEATAAFNDFREKFKETDVGSIRVHRIPVTNRTTNAAKIKTIYLFSAPVDAFTYEGLLDHILDNYGGGTYRIIGTAAGHRGAKFNRIIEIEAPKAPKPDAHGVDYTGGQRPGGGVNAGELVNQFGAVMLESQARMEEMFARFQQGPAGDPMDQLTKMATAFGSIFGAMGIKPEKPKSLAEQLTEFAAVKELLGGGSGDGGEANLFSLLTETVKNFGPLLGTAIAAQTDAGAIPKSGPVALPNPARSGQMQPDPAATAPEGEAMSDSITAMRPQIHFLLMQAKAGADAGAVAEAILPGIPDDKLEDVEEFLKRDDYLEVMAVAVPAAASQATWLEQWRTEMLVQISALFVPETGAETPSEAADGAGGDLTPPAGPAENSAAVAGERPETGDATESQSADTAQVTDNIDPDGPPVGTGGHARDAGSDAGDGAPV